MRQEKAVASNRPIVPMPLREARMPSHVASVPIANGVTRPTPVTTTRRDKVVFSVKYDGAPPRMDSGGTLLLGGLVLDVLDGVFDSRDLFRVFVGDLELEGLFESHYQLHDVQRIGAQVVNERRVAIHLAFIDAELLDNNLLHLLLYRHESSCQFWERV